MDKTSTPSEKERVVYCFYIQTIYVFKTLFPRYSDSSASILSTSYCHAPKGPSGGTVRCVDRPHANCSARVAAAGAACYEDFGQLGDAALRGQRLRATTPPLLESALRLQWWGMIPCSSGLVCKTHENGSVCLADPQRFQGVDPGLARGRAVDVCCASCHGSATGLTVAMGCPQTCATGCADIVRAPSREPF